MPVENLRLVLWRGRTWICEFERDLDPQDLAELREQLRAAVVREGWSEDYLPDFTLEVHEPGTRRKRVIAW